ncbi:MAG: chromate transporter [Proteobacteria bacterium]|jgi:chromate transporter|nr:chromate transporter [Pseudomonadota bacterium]
MNIYLELFLVFSKVGVCTFGGGYAMLPILQREVVETRHWTTDDELNDYFAIGQCTPGIIAVNTATFIGAKQRGIFGGIVATLGVVFPSILIITIIAACLTEFQEYEAVRHAFAGIRACVCILILNAVIKLAKTSLIDLPTILIFIAVFLLSALVGLSPAILVAVCGVVGFAIKSLRTRRNSKDLQPTAPDTDNSSVSTTTNTMSTTDTPDTEKDI